MIYYWKLDSHTDKLLLSFVLNTSHDLESREKGEEGGGGGGRRKKREGEEGGGRGEGEDEGKDGRWRR